MRAGLPILAALPALTLLTACPIEPPSFDAGGIDAGIDEACLDQPMSDSGVILTACNPADGTRCDISRFQACVWDVLADEGSCECSSVRVALGEQCDLGRQNCEPGTTCLFFSGDLAPTCRSVCRFDDGTGCEALQAAMPDNAFVCAPVRRGPDGAPTTNFGVCVDAGQACDPLDDRCPADQKCSLLGRETACAAVGVAGPGELCESSGCQRGSLCVALADMSGTEVPPTCYEPCAVSNPSCMMGECLDIGLGFGICYTP